MNFQRQTLANWVGFVSLFLAVWPVVFVFHADSFPNNALTAVIFYGGIGGSLFAALVAGVVSSRWWFVALLGGVVDVIVALGFSP